MDRPTTDKALAKSTSSSSEEVTRPGFPAGRRKELEPPLSELPALQNGVKGSSLENAVPARTVPHPILTPSAPEEPIPRLFDHLSPESTSRHSRPMPVPPLPDELGLEARAQIAELELPPPLPPPPAPAPAPLKLPPRPPLSTEPAPHPGPADLHDIQGLVYHAWGDHPLVAYQFATFGDAALGRAWLAAVQPQVTASTGYDDAGGRLHVALSAAGLRQLGVPEGVVEQLPQEARAGMRERARILGDEGTSGWSLGSRDELHALVMMFARDEEARAEMVERQRAALLAGGATLAAVELSQPTPEQREHFGFIDGISQPFIHGLYPEARHGRDTIAAGEIVLGYPNEYRCLPQSPQWDGEDLGRNGSFLVFRKLEQHVEEFWGHLAETARAMGPTAGEHEMEERAEYLAAKMIGRWPNGASLVRAPHHDDPAQATRDVIDDIQYRSDPEGLRCPISSHVRRANPRDALGTSSPSASQKVIRRHRILRRGRAFGPRLPRQQAMTGEGDAQPRGLYFICLQTSIARGFEFIQQSWLNNRGFSRLAGEADPLTSAGCPFTIPAEPVRLRLPPTPRFVTTRGGGYFFLPSLTALARIATGS
jgi:Dyp-type peroxidase family